MYYKYKKFWDRRALRYESYGRVLPPNMTRADVEFESNRQVEIITKYCPNVNSMILDAGCGIGRISNKLYAKGYSICGVDTSANMINAAKQTMSGVEYEVADLKCLPFRDNCFDLVFELSVLLHVPDDIVEVVASEFKRVSTDRILIFPSVVKFKSSKYFFYRDIAFYTKLFAPFSLYCSELVTSKWGKANAMLFKKE